MDRVSKAENVLNNIVRDGVILPTSKAFLLASLDPFHDKPLPDLKGWPDIESTASVIRCIKQSKVMSVPPGGGNWDCSIINWPNFNAQTTNVTTLRANNILNNFTSASGWGGLQAYVSPTGVPMNYTLANGVDLSLDPEFLSGSSRLIGVGFEVHNTTAELYRQGSVIVWRSPGTGLQTACFTQSDGTGAFRGVFSGNLVRCPPLNADSALLLPGSRQWAAAEGVYCVGTFTGISNPPMLPDYDVPVIYVTEQEDVVGAVNTSPLLFANQYTSGTIFGAYPQRWYPINTYGAFFQGLSEQTSLTITWNVYIETFPSVSEKSLLVLATPSSPFDPHALELYDKCLSAMPVGVMVKENFLGTWFPAVISAGVSLIRSWLKSRGEKEASKQVKVAGKAINRGARVYNTKQIAANSKFMAPPSSGPASQKVRNPNKQKKVRKIVYV